jgi:hypothetical protein
MEQAARLMAARFTSPTAFVFGDECGGQVKDFKTAWRLACKRAGIVGLRFHDLRREAGSRMMEAPGPHKKRGTPVTTVTDAP